MNFRSDANFCLFRIAVERKCDALFERLIASSGTDKSYRGKCKLSQYSVPANSGRCRGSHTVALTSTVPLRLIMRLTQSLGIAKRYNYSVSWGLREVHHGSAASRVTCDGEMDHNLTVHVLQYDGQSATARSLYPFGTLAEAIGIPYAIRL